MKYKLTNNFIILDNKKLYKIEALRDFATVKKGQLGGWVENENNLSQDGECWIYGNAKIYDNARVLENAVVCDNAEVCDDAEVSGNSFIGGNARIFGNAKIFGNAYATSEAEIDYNLG